MDVLNDRQYNKLAESMALGSDWAPSLPSLALGEPPNLLEPQFPHLQNGI